MALWYDCGNGWVKTRGLARSNLGADVYLCCPGPSLAGVDASRLTGPGRMIVAVTTAYPAVRPDVWVGTDVPECYSRQLWAEPFIKVVRGNYHRLRCQGRPLKGFPHVLFADIDNAEFCEMLDRRGHDTNFIWNRNTFTTALHLVIWMGARRICLVGCDFGGAGDYHDGRALTETHREGNRRLYANLVDDLRRLGPRAKARGIELVSCTPGSPVNEFLPFVALPDALARSASAVPDSTAPLLHAADAEWCQWRGDPRPGQGVIVGLDAGREWLMPWWFDTFRRHNDLPVAFADFGMTAAMRDWCADRGSVVDVADAPVPAAALRRPFAVLRAPFEEILWLEPECEVRGAVGPLLALSREGGVALMPAATDRAVAAEAGDGRSAPSGGAPAWDGAMLAIRHGHSLATDWAAEVVARGSEQENDREALARVIARRGYAVRPIPLTLASDQHGGPGAAAAVCRWTGEDGQAALRERLKAEAHLAAPSPAAAPSQRSDDPRDGFGVMVPVCQGQEDLVAWWWWAYARHNRWPVAFADFGMDAGTRRWCEARGRVTGHGAPPGIEGWFRKPFALLRSPFGQTIWTDLDCEVRADLSQVAALCGGRLGIGRDWSYPTVLRNQLPFEGPCWCSALVVCRHDDPLLPEWAEAVRQEHSGFRSDQEVLSALLNKGPSDAFVEIPVDLLRSRQEGEADGLAVVHWSGPGGKGAIRRAWAAIQAGLGRDMRSAFWHDWSQTEPTSDRGVILGLDENQEWMLDWWWLNYSEHTDLPVLFADFGMTEAGRRRCAERGVVSEPILLDCYGWFKKPLALLRSPFRKAIWLDTDCEVRGPLARLFDFCEDGGIGMALDRGTPQPYLEAMPPDAPIYNSGALVFNHGDPVVPQWASMTLALRSDRPGDAQYGQPGDQETLALTLRQCARGRIREIPMDLVRLRLSDGDGPALVMHWTGPVGKDHIREVAKQGRPQLAGSPA